MKPIIAIHDAKSGKIETREMNEKEYKTYLADQEKAAAELAEINERLAPIIAARESAIAKLTALGLTEAEIQALAG
jgi:hypothetical protein